MNDKLERVYRQIPKSKCKPTCGKCCGILYPSMAELRNIQEWCQIHNKPYRDFTMVVGEDCPYLSIEKNCSIYPVRPFLCRILGVSEDKRLQCPNCVPEKILNVTNSHYLYTQIYGGRKERRRDLKHIKELVRLL